VSSDIHSVLVGEVFRKAGMVAKASGSAITGGTVNYYLKCLTGTNAGKWWDGNSWETGEQANAMTHQADGGWTVELAATPFVDAIVYYEYAKESGDLHVAGEGRLLRGCAVKQPATVAAGDSVDVTTLLRALVMHSTTIATLDLQSDFTLADGSTDDDAYNGCLVIVRDASTATRRCMGFVKDYTGSTRRVVLAAIPGVAGFVLEANDLVDIIPCGAKAVWDELLTAHAIGLSAGAVLTALSNYDIVHTGTAAAIDTVAGLWIQLTSGASTIDNKYVDQVIFILTGTDAGAQQRLISSYDGATKKAYFNRPLAGTTFTAGTYCIKAGAYIPVPYIADAVLDELTAGHAVAGSAGKALTDILADTGTDGVVVATASKTGYGLAADGLDSITVTEPTGKPTTFRGWLMWLVQRFRRASKTPTTILVKTEAGATVTTQTVTDDGAGTETLGPPT